MRKLVAACSTLTVLAVSLSGCGGGGGAAPTAVSASSESGSPSTTADAFPSEAAKSAAGQALLTISDFPAGWSSSPNESDDSNDQEMNDQLAACLHAPAGLFDDGVDEASADSPDFNSPDGNTTVSETVSVSPTVRVEQGFRVLKQANATQCLSQAMDSYMKKQMATSDDPAMRNAILGTLEVGQLSAGTFGDDTIAMRVSIPITTSGMSVSVYVDVLFVRHANAVANLTFEAVGSPVDAQTTAQFARVAAAKMSKVTFPDA